MKKTSVPALLLLIIAALTAFGSQSFLSPCVHEDGTFGACHWAGQALLGIGCTLGILAILALAVKQARFGIYLSAMPVCLLGILTPGTIISLCRASTMRCRMVMQPAMIILFAVALLSALVGSMLSVRR